MAGMGASRCSIMKLGKLRPKKGGRKEQKRESVLCPKCSADSRPMEAGNYECPRCGAKFKSFAQVNVKVTR
jgi:predicted amidophosphoribosyltransferase